MLTCRQRDRCIAIASDYLTERKSVAVGTFIRDTDFRLLEGQIINSNDRLLLDNTNADSDIRAKWIALATKHDVSIRCVYFTASTVLCQHNDAVRALNGDLVSSNPFPFSTRLEIRTRLRSMHTKRSHVGHDRDIILMHSSKIQMNPEKRVMLPVTAFRGFASRFQEPKLEEGFVEIIRIDFQVSRH